MHVIALEKYPSSQRGGQELSLFDVCRGLAQQSHVITLMHVETGNLLSQYQTFCHQIIHLPGFGLSRQQFWKFPIDLFRAWKHLHRHTPSLLYCNQIYDIPAPALLSICTHSPLVCHLRLPPPQKLDPIRQSAISHVDRFITVSHHTRQQWIDFGIPAHKITCIHNGVDIDRFTPNPDCQALRQQLNLPTHAKILAYTGRLDQRKGVEILLEALAKLHSHHPNLHLLIAGKALLDGPSYQATLHQKTINLGLTDVVHFLGHISDPRPLYCTADLTISPSIWAEPFGKVIIESMACGTPVIASRIGGIPEILTEQFAQGLCQPNDSQDLANIIDRLLHWKEINPSLSQECRQHIVQRFSLSHTIVKIESELRQVFQSSTTKHLDTAAQPTL